MVKAFERLRRLSPADAAAAMAMGHKCQANVPETFHPPDAQVCQKPIVYVAQANFGDVTKWWYSCEECAKPIMKEIGFRA